MKVEFFFGGYICSILQVVALVVCFRGNASGEIAQGCVESQLSLSCPDMKVIQITAVVLGDSKCLGASCCIRDDDCTYNASENHRTHVYRRCDNKQSCTVDVLRERIVCNSFLGSSNNDFERIIYMCRDDTRNVTTRSTDVQPTVDTFSHSSGPDDSGNEERHTPNAPGTSLGIVIACVVSLIVIIAIVASLSVVTIRRKKRHQMESSDAVKKSDLEADREETIYVNEAQRPSLEENAGSSFPIYSNESSTEVEKPLTSDAKNLETLASDYCELEGVATGRIQCDSEYEQLDHGGNYEPLVVYEQLQ